MDDQYVVHDSGNPRHKFIYGFYLYYLPHKMLAKTGEALTYLYQPLVVQPEAYMVSARSLLTIYV